jgi:hypothetical protein
MMCGNRISESDENLFAQFRIKRQPGRGWSRGMRFVNDDRICIICGNPFHVPPSILKRGRSAGLCCSNSCRAREMAVNPSKFPKTIGRRGKGGFREDLGIYLRSTWEANYARYLDFLLKAREIRSWEYEAETFEFNGIKRGNRFYTPDFKVINRDGSIEYHEVKGWMDPRSATKLKRMAHFYPEIKIVIIDQKQMLSIRGTAGNLIPKWEKGIKPS